MSKINKDLNESRISDLREHFYKSATKDGFNLTFSLDGKVNQDFDQELINEIVLWKINRYVTTYNSKWLEDFNKLKDIKENEFESKKDWIDGIIERMQDSNGIRLPMASTMLRFRNPNIFQIIDVRTFRVIFENEDDYLIKKKKLDANNEESRSIYFDYLTKLRKYCDLNKIVFSEADRILYQYDIDQGKKIKNSEKG